jgi:hypothetical protein
MSGTGAKRMIIHITPRLYATEPSELVDVQIPEINLHLTALDDLMVCRPYRNKVYLVACLKGTYGYQGLIVKASQTMNKFSVITRWNVLNKGIAEHVVKYTVADDFDFENGMFSDDTARMEVKTVIEWTHNKVADTIVDGYIKQRIEESSISSQSLSTYTSNRHWNHKPALENMLVLPPIM